MCSFQARVKVCSSGGNVQSGREGGASPARGVWIVSPQKIRLSPNPPPALMNVSVWNLFGSSISAGAARLRSF